MKLKTSCSNNTQYIQWWKKYSLKKVKVAQCSNSTIFIVFLLSFWFPPTPEVRHVYNLYGLIFMNLDISSSVTALEVFANHTSANNKYAAFFLMSVIQWYSAQMLWRDIHTRPWLLPAPDGEHWAVVINGRSKGLWHAMWHAECGDSTGAWVYHMRWEQWTDSSVSHACRRWVTVLWCDWSYHFLLFPCHW